MAMSAGNRALLIVSILAAGCLSFNPASGTLRCSDDAAHPCPDGYACVSGACWKNGEQPDLSGDGTDMATPMTANGATCSSAAECMSGNCVDGVCCDTACAGSCMGCNLTGKAGTCSPLSAGDMPVHGSCSATSMTTCGNDGTCDGAGECRKWSAGTTCAPGSCSSGIQKSASQCDGNGNCLAGASIACDPYVCNTAGTACFTQCTDNTQCLAPNPCNTTTKSCGPKNNGLGCSAGTDCKSGNCVDTVCCDTPQSSCSGCKSCNLPGSAGTCSNVASGQDPHAACTGKTCAAGGCNGSGSCTPATSGAVCAISSCSNATDTYGQWVNISATVMTCDGTSVGSCPGSPMTQGCPGSLVCASATTCKTSCTVDPDCTYPAYCSAGTCVGKGQAGQPCSNDNQCFSRVCVGGVCKNCRTGLDCGTDPICTAAGNCSACQSATDCSSIGNGDGCNTTLLDCTCSSSASCTSARVDRCANLGDHMGCSCGGLAPCGAGMNCVSGTCRNVTGRPCVQASDCVSGTCSNGACT